MMKMVIQMDEDKIRREGKHSLEKVYQVIDKTFAEFECIREKSDILNELIYAGNPKRDDSFCDFGIIYGELDEQEWFRANCIKWRWLDNDDDESLPYSESDVLNKVRTKDERATKRAIEFKLDTKKMKEYFPNYTAGYAKLQKSLKKYGFARQNCLGYVSNIELTIIEIFDIVKKITKENPWLGSCAKKLSVTNIGEQRHYTSLEDFFNKNK